MNRCSFFVELVVVGRSKNRPAVLFSIPQVSGLKFQKFGKGSRKGAKTQRKKGQTPQRDLYVLAPLREPVDALVGLPLNEEVPGATPVRKWTVATAS